MHSIPMPIKTRFAAFILTIFTSNSQASMIEERTEINETENSAIAIDFVLNDLMERSKQGTNETPVFRRAFHNKANACLIGQFSVYADIPSEFKIGLFAEAKTFNAWLRYSNGSSKRNADSTRQPRALAFKVLDTKIPMLESEEGSNYSHDFLMANQSVFFLKSLEELVTDGIDFFNGEFFGLPFNALERFNRAATPSINPLQTQFFSQSAYALGTDKAVKYRLSPCINNANPEINRSASNGIRAALYEGASQQENCYVFSIQQRQDPENEPIENPTIEWKSPFYPIAQLDIPQQGFNDISQDKLCEELSFNPWHAGSDHRPLGALNRVRQLAYKLAALKRRGALPEPASDSIENFGLFYVPVNLTGKLSISALFLLTLLYLFRRH